MRGSKGLIASLVVVVIVVAGAVYATHSKKNTNTAMNMSTPTSHAATSSQPASPDTVDIKNYAFTPTSMTVKVGTKVTWTNQDSVKHTVTADSGVGPSSQLLAQGESYSYTFSKAGTYSYHCTPHTYMKATVTVTD